MLNRDEIDDEKELNNREASEEESTARYMSNEQAKTFLLEQWQEYFKEEKLLKKANS